eukprot:2362938-Alexandrium_andersonii.AAC.1
MKARCARLTVADCRPATGPRAPSAFCITHCDKAGGPTRKLLLSPCLCAHVAPRATPCARH